jgi:hypothetical protein
VSPWSISAANTARIRSGSTTRPRAGSFACSDDYLNRVYRTSLRTIEGNIHSILEDCPHREKCAWLGDTHAVGETLIFNYDDALVLSKFMADVETVCGPARGTYEGKKGTPGIPSNVAVGRRLPQEARPDWGDAVVLAPWYLYVYYGDTRVMAEHYPLMEHHHAARQHCDGVCAGRRRRAGPRRRPPRHRRPEHPLSPFRRRPRRLRNRLGRVSLRLPALNATAVRAPMGALRLPIAPHYRRLFAAN